MRAIDLSAITDGDLARRDAIAAEAGVDLKDCYQCGKCTAGCPMAHGMDLMPREVVRLLQLGAVDEVLNAKTPWICAQCEVCSTRCPQNVDICSLMRAVRLNARAAGITPVREAEIFEGEFISSVSKHGVSNEQYLAAWFNLKSGHLMQDMGNAVRMLSRGLVGVATHNTQGREDVRALIERADAADAKRRAAARDAIDAKAKGGDAR